MEPHIQLLPFILHAFSTVVVIVNPLVAAPMMTALLPRASKERRLRTASRASWAAFLTLVGFALLGSLIFRAYGITLDAFRIAGGILIFSIAFSMIYGQTPGARLTSADEEEGQTREDVAVVPLGIPMLSGPGAITTVMVLMGEARGPSQALMILIAIAVACGFSSVVLRYAHWLVNHARPTGLRAITRIMGLLLAAVAVQFVANGIRSLISTW